MQPGLQDLCLVFCPFGRGWNLRVSGKRILPTSPLGLEKTINETAS